MKHSSSEQEEYIMVHSMIICRKMFHGKGDATTIRRLADDESDEEEVSSKWEEPVIASQHNSVTPKETSDNMKTGSKRPLSNQASCWTFY